MKRHNITAKVADGHPCVMFMIAKGLMDLLYTPPMHQNLM